MRGPRLAIVLPFVLWLLQSAVWTAPAQSLPGHGLSASERPTYIAVLGHVARPGVYETTEDFPSLFDVVRRAGGLRQTASHNVRIIRHGRAGQQAYYFSDSRLKLFRGDVVVVEGMRSGGSGRIPQHLPTVESDPSGSLATIQLALVNLIDRPVVIRLPPDQATLSDITAILRQPQESIPHIRVIEDGTAHLRRNGPITPSTLLESGSVLVFDPALVAVDRLPPLPDPIATDKLNSLQPTAMQPDRQTAGLRAGARESEITEADELRNGVAHVPTPGVLRAPDDGLRADEIDESPPNTVADDAVDLFDDSLFDAIWNGGSRISAGSSESESIAKRRIGDDKDVHRARPMDVPLGTEPRQTPSIANDRQSDRFADQPTPSSATRSMLTTIAIAVVACLLAVVGFTFLWSMARRTRSSAENRPGRARPFKKVFNSLIENELPVMEEPLDRPAKTEFYRRPTGVRNIRIDGGHSIDGPHIRPPRPDSGGSRQTTGRPSEHQGGPREAAASKPKGPTGTPLARSEEAPSGLLDRVLSAIHAAGAHVS